MLQTSDIENILVIVLLILIKKVVSLTSCKLACLQVMQFRN